MTSTYFKTSGNPQVRSRNASSPVRVDLAAIAAAFALLPPAAGGGQQGFSGGIFYNPVIRGVTLTGGGVGGVGSGLEVFVAAAAVNISGDVLAAAQGTGTVGLCQASTGSAAAAMQSNQVNRQIWDQAGNVVIGNGVTALATNATAGFLHIPKCAGTPTGVPATLYGSSVPMVYDSTNNKIGVYNGAWKQTAALT